MNKLKFIILAFFFVIGSCENFPKDRKLEKRVEDFEKRIQNIEQRCDSIEIRLLADESYLKEWIIPPEPKLYYRVKDDGAHIRSSPKIDKRINNIIGMIESNSYVQRLETIGDWLKIKLSIKQNEFIGYVHKTLVEEAHIGEREYQKNIEKNNFALNISTKIKSIFTLHKIGSSGLPTVVGLNIIDINQTNSYFQIQNKIENFFSNLDPTKYLIKPISATDFVNNPTLECIIEVKINNDSEQFIKIYRRDMAMIFSENVNFDFVE